MDTKKILSVRQSVARAKEGSKGRARYSQSVKSSVLELLRSGMRCSEICRTTGLVPATVSNWKRAHGSFRRVRVMKSRVTRPENSETPFKVTLPNGICLEGASMGTLREIFGWFE